jgi:hypothetical protein
MLLHPLPTEQFCQTRWFLCAEDDWRLDDGLFKKDQFFNMIARLFEVCPDDPWCIDTLEWWNTYVPCSSSVPT